MSFAELLHESVFSLQESTVHPIESEQELATPEHVPCEQTSFIVQNSPSLHGAVLNWLLQPVKGLHESSVQILPSSQLI